LEINELGNFCHLYFQIILYLFKWTIGSSHVWPRAPSKGEDHGLHRGVKDWDSNWMER